MLKTKAKIKPLDLILLALIGAGLVWLVYRANAKLYYKWNWSIIPTYLVRHDPARGWVPNMLLQGLLTTIRISLWTMVPATILGTVMGVFRTSKSLFLRLISRTYVELVRNLPPLVLIFIVYFFLSDQLMAALGVDEFIRSRTPETQRGLAVLFAPPEYFTAFFSALLTMALYEGAYITEIVRSGIQSVHKGQWEAAHALGLSHFQTMTRVILPLTAQRVMPPLAGQFISTIKDSAIVSVISVQELTFQGLELMASTQLIFEIWITVTLLYLCLTLTCSLLSRKLELYLNRSRS